MPASFGSISHGTMRAEDLIPAFAAELESLDSDKVHANLVKEANDWCDGENDESLNDPSEIVEELFDALNEFAPAYGYFGAHPDDGADYGFWLSEDFQRDMQDNDVLEVSDTSEVPADYYGEVLHVNDHGNATLYVATDGELKEVWAVV